MYSAAYALAAKIKPALKTAKAQPSHVGTPAPPVEETVWLDVYNALKPRPKITGNKRTYSGSYGDLSDIKFDLIEEDEDEDDDDYEPGVYNRLRQED